MNWRPFSVACMVALSSMASAQSGNELLATCSHLSNPKMETVYDAGRCAGFIEGSMRTMEVFMMTLRTIDPTWVQPYCIPPKATYNQITAVFARHLEQHPETRHQSSGVLFLLAMSKAFPCRKN